MGGITSGDLPTVSSRCHGHDERVRAERDTARRRLRVAYRVHLHTKKHKKASQKQSSKT